MPCSQVGPPRGYLRDQYVLGEILRVARYLFSEEVYDAELHAQAPPELGILESSGYAVAKIIYPGKDDERPAFIVFRDGARYTTGEIPADFDGIVTEIKVTEPTGIVLLRLKALARALQRSAPDLYNKSCVQSTIEGAMRRTANPVDGTRVYSVLLQCPSTEESLREHKVPIISRSKSLDSELRQAFLEFKLTGREYQRAAAVLTFFALQQDTTNIEDVYWSLYKSARGDLSDLDEKPRPLPPMEIQVYLAHPLSHPHNMFWARGASRLLRRVGKQHVDAASSSQTITEFHSKLYAGLACYRAAFEILTKLKGLGNTKPKIVGTTWVSRGGTASVVAGL